jgi:WD40 repeat protein
LLDHGHYVEPVAGVPVYLQRYGRFGIVEAVAVSEDGRIVVSLGSDSCLRRAVDGVADARPLLRYEGKVNALALSGDGRIVAIGGEDAAIRLWIAEELRPLVYLCNAAVRHLSLTRDGRRIVGGLQNGEILMLDLITLSRASSGGPN